VLGSTARFTDVSGDLRFIAEYVTASGSTSRDFDFTPTGMMSATGTKFNPSVNATRLDMAIAFVKAVGRDAEARSLANAVVTWDGTPLTDNSQIPAALRGYVQIALDKGMFEAFPAEVRQTAPGVFVVVPGPRFEPASAVTRATLAAKLLQYRSVFTTGG
jgi:serine protease AprX